MDPYDTHTPALDSPARGGAAAVPHPTRDLPRASRALWVGQGGDVDVETVDGSRLTLANVPGGTLLPLRVRALRSATSARGVVALW